MYFRMNDVWWKLVIVRPFSSELKRSDGSYTIGVTDNNSKRVYISSGLSDTYFNRVLCHELCHVASFSYNLEIPIETEEIIANFLSLYGKEVFEIAEKILRYIADRKVV